MTFDDITEDGRLWAVRYGGDEDNFLDSLFDQWNDVAWLRVFFKANSKDLEGYYTCDYERGTESVGGIRISNAIEMERESGSAVG